MRTLADFRMLVVVAILLACGACTASTGAHSDDEQTATARQAITNGDDDDTDPAVVALLIGGKVYCTGALVTSNMIVTAAHCVSPSPPEQVYFGSKPSSKKGTFMGVVDSKMHPDFDEDTLENDIGLVVIDGKAEAKPLTFLTDDFDKTFIGHPIRIVGFGAPAGGGEVADLRKRTGATKIESYGDDDFRFKPGPSQTCSGDSGGPSLATIDDQEVIIGLASSGDQSCKEYGRNMRIDRYEPFIHGYAKAYSARIGADGSGNSGCAVASTGRTPSSRTSVALLFGLAWVCAAGRRRARRRATYPCTSRAQEPRPPA